MKYRVLSIKQPWAWLIIHWQGSALIPPKRIENRKTLKHIRGEFLIHTGKKVDMTAYDVFADLIGDTQDREFRFSIPGPADLDKGGIVGKMEIVDCVTDSDSIWAIPGQNHLVLDNVKPLPFMACPGRQGVFEVDYDGESIKFGQVQRRAC